MTFSTLIKKCYVHIQELFTNYAGNTFVRVCLKDKVSVRMFILGQICWAEKGFKMRILKKNVLVYWLIHSMPKVMFYDPLISSGGSL